MDEFGDFTSDELPVKGGPLGWIPMLPQGVDNELGKIFAALTQMNDIKKIVASHVTAPYNIKTPEEKIKKRPDGYDYIENTWMDKSFKDNSPLYLTELVHYSEGHGWITIIVKLTDRITGNSELGADSARIQVRQGTSSDPTFRDIVDKGNNVKSALSRAIKNAQSRFGHGADVYGKREGTVTEEEKSRYKVMYDDISKISSIRADQFKTGWEKLGVDFTDYLDRWQFFIDQSNKRKAPAEVRKASPQSDAGQ